MSLRTRITGVAGLAVAVAVVIGAALAYYAIRSELRGEVDTALRDRAQIFDRFAPDAALGVAASSMPAFPGEDPDHDGRPGPGPPRDFMLFSQRVPIFGGAPGYVQFVGQDGLITRAPGETGVLPVGKQALAIAHTGYGRRLDDVDASGNHLRVLTVGVGELGAVQVARPLAEVDSVLHRVLVILILMSAGGIAVGAAMGFGVSRTALAPVRRFTSGTEDIATAGDVSRRMDVHGDDELARLARSFNTTLDELERSVEAQRQLVADASHELRTPMASLRANIQVLEDADRLPPAERVALRDDIVSELDELTALVADITELARGSQPEDVADDIRLDLIVEALVERAQRRPGNEVTYNVLLEPTLVSGRPERISRAVSNLLDNARKWSPPGGIIEIRLSGGRLSVRDHGPGFAEEDLPHVFDRFFRSEHARGMPGSGLGLAIVRQAAEERGGSASAENAAGGGALVKVQFSYTAHTPSVESSYAAP